MTTSSMVRNVRLKAITALMLFVISMVFFCISAVMSESTPSVYVSESDPNMRLEVENGIYTLNGEKLQYQETGFWEVIWDSMVINRTPILFDMVSVIVFLCFMRFFSSLPPYRIVFQSLRGKRNKEKPYPISLLPPNPNFKGLIAHRCWRFDLEGGILKSTATGDSWESVCMEADLEPVVGGWHGIHAFRLGGDASGCWGRVGGLVSLSGTIIGHKDNMVRAQRCTILNILTTKEEQAEELRKRYSCPVTVVPNIQYALEKFVMSDEGLSWLAHNNKVILTAIKEE